MKDAVFYPLVLAVAGALVAFALTRGERVSLSPAEIAREGYGLAGGDLAQLTASPGTELVVVDGLARAVQISAREAAPASAGVFMTLPPPAEAAFSGQPLRITWRLRFETAPKAGEVQLGYFTLGDGDSGWRPFELGETWSDVTLRYRPAPATPGGAGFDFAGLWPGTGEPDGVPVLIESVRVEIDATLRP